MPSTTSQWRSSCPQWSLRWLQWRQHFVQRRAAALAPNDAVEFQLSKNLSTFYRHAKNRLQLFRSFWIVEKTCSTIFYIFLHHLHLHLHLTPSCCLLKPKESNLEICRWTGGLGLAALAALAHLPHSRLDCWSRWPFTSGANGGSMIQWSHDIGIWWTPK